MYENNYVLHSVILKFRTCKKDLFIASLDLSYGFGSLPHSVIFEALRLTGAGDEFIDIVKNIYQEAITQYKTTKVLSTPRVAATGVRQSDPLSGVLFIRGIDFILRNIQREGSVRDPGLRDLCHYILAYADDVLLLARNAQDLQALLQIINVLARKICLNFSPKKCTSLHFSSKTPAGRRPTKFNLAGEEIPFISDGELSVFLGKPIGIYLPTDEVKVDDIRQHVIKILSSMLTPWQMIDCIKTFFFPSLQFLQWTEQLSKTDMSSIDNVPRPLFKKTISLASKAANEYLYGRKEDGLFGIFGWRPRTAILPTSTGGINC